MAGRKDRGWGRLARLAGWAAVMTPLSVLLHEIGHYATARAYGYPARLDATSVAANLDRAPAWMDASQAAAGPLVTLIVTIVAARLYVRRPSREWALSLAMAAPHRYFVVTGFLAIYSFIALIGRPFRGNPNFDEHHAATSLGLRIVPVAALISLLLIAYWIWLVRRIPRGRRFSSVAAIALGAVAGMTAWVILMPPLLDAAQ